MSKIDRIMSNVITPKVKNGYPVYSPAAGPLFTFEKTGKKTSTKPTGFYSKVLNLFKNK